MQSNPETSPEIWKRWGHDYILMEWMSEVLGKLPPWGTCPASCGWSSAPQEAPPPGLIQEDAGVELLKLVWLRIWPGVPGHLRGQQILGLQTPPWIGQWQNLALRRLHKRTQFSPCYSWCVVCTVSHNGLFVPGGRILVFGKMIILIVYLVSNNSFGKKLFW